MKVEMLQCIGSKPLQQWPLGLYPVWLSSYELIILLSSSKSQSLMGAFGLKDTSFFRTASEDTANAETIRNLRKSFASLFSE